jgi:hypothetical protein
LRYDLVINTVTATHYGMFDYSERDSDSVPIARKKEKIAEKIIRVTSHVPDNVSYQLKSAKQSLLEKTTHR